MPPVLAPSDLASTTLATPVSTQLSVPQALAANSTPTGLALGLDFYLRKIGNALTMLCAVHCVLVPALLLLLPLLKLIAHAGLVGELASVLAWLDHYEVAIVVLGAVLIGTSVLLHGHASKGFWRWFGVAMVANLIGLSLSHAFLPLHTLFMVLGASAMLVASYLQARHRH